MSLFITFEGPDGSGKTSQIPLLEEFLRENGFSVISTREPGGTYISNQIREIVLANKNIEIHPRTEILLFQASRAQLVEQLIRPQLKIGTIVLCDRYADSTLAYQGYGQQVGTKKYKQLQAIIDYATGGLKPDLTLLFDINVELGLRRRKADGDINRLDAYDIEFHQRVREGYHQLIKEEPQRWEVVDAEQTPEEVQRKIREIILERLQT